MRSRLKAKVNLATQLVKERIVKTATGAAPPGAEESNEARQLDELAAALKLVASLVQRQAKAQHALIEPSCALSDALIDSACEFRARGTASSELANLCELTAEFAVGCADTRLSLVE